MSVDKAFGAESHIHNVQLGALLSTILGLVLETKRPYHTCGSNLSMGLILGLAFPDQPGIRAHLVHT